MAVPRSPRGWRERMAPIRQRASKAQRASCFRVACRPLLVFVQLDTHVSSDGQATFGSGVTHDSYADTTTCVSAAGCRRALANASELSLAETPDPQAASRKGRQEGDGGRRAHGAVAADLAVADPAPAGHPAGKPSLAMPCAADSSRISGSVIGPALGSGGGVFFLGGRRAWNRNARVTCAPAIATAKR